MNNKRSMIATSQILSIAGVTFQTRNRQKKSLHCTYRLVAALLLSDWAGIKS